MDLSFIGRGWSFPPTFMQSTYGVDMLEEEQDVASSLEILLTTTPGERTMIPGYGCNMHELVFESLTTTMKTLMVDKIKTAILYFEPRVDVEKVTLNTELENEGVILIEIIYKVRTTNARFNFVYPYYIEEGTDINLTTTVNLIPDNN
jgi:phage baseplate assembly protein W